MLGTHPVPAASAGRHRLIVLRGAEDHGSTQGEGCVLEQPRGDGDPGQEDGGHGAERRHRADPQILETSVPVKRRQTE